MNREKFDSSLFVKSMLSTCWYDMQLILYKIVQTIIDITSSHMNFFQKDVYFGIPSSQSLIQAIHLFFRSTY